MSKRAEEAAFKAEPETSYGERVYHNAFRDGYEQAEKDLIPLINRLCEAILFDWNNKAELAWEIQSKIKEETK